MNGLVLLLAAPVLEESLFRAGLHEALLRHSVVVWLANAVTATAFGLTHVAVQGDWTAFVVVLPALAIGLVYSRWRRLRWCVALHALMNAAWWAAA